MPGGGRKYSRPLWFAAHVELACFLSCVVPLPYVASICPAVSALTLCKQSALYCVTCSGSIICFWVRSSVRSCSRVCRSQMSNDNILVAGFHRDKLPYFYVAE